MLTKGKAVIVSKSKPFLLAIGTVLPVFIVVCLIFGASKDIHAAEIISAHKHMEFGMVSLAATITIYAISILIVVFCLVLSQMHYKKRKNSNGNQEMTNGASNRRKGSISPLKSGQTVLALGKKFSDTIGKLDRSETLNDALPEGAALEDCCQWKDGRKRSKYERDCQMVRHTVLLLFQSVLMFVGKLHIT